MSNLLRISFLFILLFSFSTASAQTDQNIITNGDFSDGLNDWTFEDVSTTYPTCGDWGYNAFSEADVYSGMARIRAYSAYGDGWLWQDLPESKPYSLSFYYRNGRNPDGTVWGCGAAHLVLKNGDTEIFRFRDVNGAPGFQTIATFMGDSHFIRSGSDIPEGNVEVIFNYEGQILEVWINGIRETTFSLPADVAVNRIGLNSINACCDGRNDHYSLFDDISVSERTNPSAQIELLGLVNLTNSPVPASESTVGWYPDGSKIAFAKGCDYTAPGPGTDIWCMAIEPGSSPEEIYGVPNRVNLDWPDYSPDGQTLVYVWDVVNGGDIYVIDSEGIGPPICIACESLMEIQPDWSPAGDKIIYTRGVYNFEPINIWAMNSDGSGKEQLTTGKGDTAPQWSPNGTKIAFSRKPGRYEGYNQVCVMDSDGRNIQELTSGNFNSSAPTWSPDGNYIAYVSEEGNTLPPGDLWVMKANGTEKQRLTNIGGVAFPKWSPTANIIAFQRHSGMNCDIDIYLAYLSITEETIEVDLDIKPGSCPNPINTKSRGVLPAAILGSTDFDVSQIDIASIRLAGVAPIRSSIEDLATPFEPFDGKEDADDCIGLGPDGYLDLTLKFDTQEIVAGLGDFADGDVLVLNLTGNLKEEFGGTQIKGKDVVIAKKKPEK